MFPGSGSVSIGFLQTWLGNSSWIELNWNAKIVNWIENVAAKKSGGFFCIESRYFETLRCLLRQQGLYLSECCNFYTEHKLKKNEVGNLHIFYADFLWKNIVWAQTLCAHIFSYSPPFWTGLMAIESAYWDPSIGAKLVKYGALLLKIWALRVWTMLFFANKIGLVVFS